MRVEFTDKARHDLLAIADYIAQFDPYRALTFTRELRHKCNGLAEFPERFPLTQRYASKGVRQRVHGNYLIFYRIESDKIIVLHIIHGARGVEDWSTEH